MEWLDGLLGTAASVGTGGVFGFLGAIGGSVVKYFQARQEHKFKQDEWEHELKLQNLQMQARSEETEQELAITAQQGSWGALKAGVETMKVEPHKFKFRVVNDFVFAIKDLTRPGLAAALLVSVMFMYFSLMKMLSGETSTLANVFTPGEAKDLVKYIIYSVVFAGATSWTFWFCDRAFAPPGMKNR